jgi:hypothetical protein
MLNHSHRSYVLFINLNPLLRYVTVDIMQNTLLHDVLRHLQQRMWFIQGQSRSAVRDRSIFQSDVRAFFCVTVLNRVRSIVCALLSLPYHRLLY